MLSHKVVFWIGIAAMVGCTSEPEVIETSSSIDQRLVKEGSAADGGLEARHEEFGGFYLDDRGDPTVYIKSPTRDRQVVDRIWAEIRGRDKFGLWRNRPVQVKYVSYSSAELAALRRALYGIKDRTGIIFVGIDVRENRLRVGVVSEDLIEPWRSRLSAAGIPSEAVIVERTAPVTRGALLSDVVRSTVGGLKIDVEGAGPFDSKSCSMGFNAAVPGGDVVTRFVANSHCTQVMGQVHGNVVKQPGSSGSRIGVETIDPPFASYGHCPPGTLCRRADAMLGTYDVGVNGAFEIAHTTFAGAPGFGGSTTLVSGAFRAFRVAGFLPDSLIVLGMRLYKVGNSSGWTYGTVTDRCGDYGPSTETLSCQFRFSANTLSGDSGSPVFYIDSDSTAWIAGIYWGRTVSDAVFSTYQGIQTDLGSLRVSSWSDVVTPDGIGSSVLDIGQTAYGLLTVTNPWPVAKTFALSAQCGVQLSGCTPSVGSLAMSPWTSQGILVSVTAQSPGNAKVQLRASLGGVAVDSGWVTMQVPTVPAASVTPDNHALTAKTGLTKTQTFRTDNLSNYTRRYDLSLSCTGTAFPSGCSWSWDGVIPPVIIGPSSHANSVVSFLPGSAGSSGVIKVIATYPYAPFMGQVMDSAWANVTVVP